MERSQRKRTVRGHAAVIALLAVLVLLSRLPWLSGSLYDFDSIGFAEGVERFDVSAHSPHPPGYSLYIATGKLFRMALRDPNRSLVWVSVTASMITVGLMYALGRSLFSPPAGLIAAGLLLVSPLFWTFGEVCAPYVFSALFSILIALLVRAGSRGRPRHFYFAAIAIGLGSGFRPEIALVMSPLWLYFLKDVAWKDRLLCLLTCAGCFLLWFVPTVLLSGGWGPYLEAVRLQSAGIWDQGFLINTAKVGAYGLWGLGGAVLLLPRCLGGVRALPGGTLLFFALWGVPYLLLATLVSFGQPGMLLVFLPPVLLLLAGTLPPGAATGRPARVLLAAVVCVGVLLFAGAPFLSAKGFVDDDATFLDRVQTEFFLLSGPGISFSDRYYRGHLETIREAFPPDETLIFTNFKGWPYARYYLRGYRVHNYFCFYGLNEGRSHYIPEGTFAIPAGVRYIVLFNGDKHSIVFRDTLTPYNHCAEVTRVRRVPGGMSFQYLDVTGRREILFRPDGFFVNPRA